jgi:hypothetical protein
LNSIPTRYFIICSFEENAEQDCTQELGAYLSGAAIICFFLASIFMCCTPRPDPFCNQCEWSSASKKNNETEDGSSSRKSINKQEQPPAPSRQQSAIVPVVNPAREGEEPNNDDVDEPSIIMNSASDDEDVYVEEKDNKAKINDEEFLEGDVPPASASRVTLKEKTFPDGSREVEETTHYQDGSTSVKTKSFKK